MIRYYRVIEKKNKRGQKVLKVQSTENIFGVLFNVWDEYKKDNYVLAQAIDQIEVINGSQIVDSKTIYKIKASELNKVTKGK